MTRPGPVRWLRYVFTGSLPIGYREWVWHDITGSTWLLRHCSRFLLELAPFIAAVFVLLPGPLILRVGCVAAGIGAAVAFSFGYVVEMADKRAIKAGYSTDLAERTRELRAEQAQRATAARYRAKVAARTGQ